MSSPAARAHEQRRKTRGDFYCERPADVADNSPLPRYGWLVQHALIMSYAIVLKAMWSLRPRELRGTGDALLNNASISRIAKATARFTNPLSDAIGEPMPRRTVAHCLTALTARGFVTPWEIESHARTSPVGTSWRISRYDAVLQRWADDPDIGTVGKRCFYVSGKGRRFLTPAELIAWKLDNTRAEQQGVAAVVELPEPSIDTGPEAPAQPAVASTPRASMPQRRMTVQEHLIEDTAIVHRAILAGGVAAEPEEAAALLDIARQIEASIPATSVAMLVTQLSFEYAAQERRRLNTSSDVRVVWTIGWYLNDMAKATHRWRFDAAQRATGSAR